MSRKHVTTLDISNFANKIRRRHRDAGPTCRSVLWSAVPLDGDRTDSDHAGQIFLGESEMAFLTGALAAQRERERAAAKLAKGDVARRA
jgi:hypothetical protein